MTRTAKLYVFHPSPYMVEEIDALLRKLAPEIEHKNIIESDMLDSATATGISDELIARVKKIVADIPRDHKAVILCACSTFGGIAESMHRYTCHPIIRIDRPMAELAVSLGSQIGIAAALESTIEPTRKLLQSVAEDLGQQITIKEIICKDAWAFRLKKDQEAYVREIVKDIEAHSDSLDAVVLAQGSMAPASTRLKHLPMPVLSSPKLAVERVKVMCAQIGLE